MLLHRASTGEMWHAGVDERAHLPEGLWEENSEVLVRTRGRGWG